MSDFVSKVNDNLIVFLNELFEGGEVSDFVDAVIVQKVLVESEDVVLDWLHGLRLKWQWKCVFQTTKGNFTI